MSSQFNAFAATVHRADLHRDAERARRVGDREGSTASPLPNLLRSRRLGRLVRLVPSPGRHSA